MKKIFVTIAFLATILGQGMVWADPVLVGDALSKVPALKQGVAFSVVDNNWNYLATLDIVKYKGFSFEAGYAGRAENTQDKVVAVVSYDLFKLKNFIDLPILDLIEFRPGVWVGYGRLEHPQGGEVPGELDYGVSATVVSVKF